MVVRTYFKVFFASCFLAVIFFAQPAFGHVEPSYNISEEDFGKGLIAFAVILILHLYVGAAMFALARRLNVCHRWRAWVPIANLSLFISLAGKSQWWFVGLFSIPEIWVFLGMSISGLENAIPFGALPEVVHILNRTQNALLSPFILILLVGVECMLLMYLCGRLAARCGYPRWLGLLAFLVPPVGFVLLGIIAWSKKLHTKIPMSSVIPICSVIIIVIGVLAYLGFNKFNASLSENEALKLLTDTITYDSLYDSFTTLQCLDFSTSETTKEYFRFTVYEIHGNGCEGDPNTHPRVDTFKVMRRTKNILYYDVLEDAYFPYDFSKLKR